MVKLSKLILVVLITSMFAFPANVALGYHLPITISNPLPSSDDSFGWAVSIDGNKILVGAYGGGR